MVESAAETRQMGKKQVGFLMFLCWFSYTCAYLGRLNYSANLVQIVEELGITKAQGGLVASFFFFSYGAGQIIHGMLNKYYKPRWIIAAGLILSAIWNMLMPFVSLNVMMVLWMFNGLTQSVLWTTFTRVLSMYLDDQALKKAVIVMGTCVATGTCLIYGISALFVEFLNWRFSFYFASLLLLIAGLLWFFGYGSVTRGVAPRVAVAVKGKEKQKKASSSGLILFFAVIFLFSALHHLIKDGLVTWTPSIFYELYGLPESYSILLTLGLPLLSLPSSIWCVQMNRKYKDHITLCGFFFAFSLIFTAIMVVCMPLNIWWITLICFAVAVLAMSALNNVITSLIPLQMRDRVDSAKTAGFVNAFCYLGSTIATYALGALADGFGWYSIFYLVLILTAASVLVSVIYLPLKKKYPIDN